MNFIEFTEVMKNDPDLREEFRSCANLEDAYKIASGAGLSIPFEQFSEYMQKIASINVELSDEDLEAISAGCSGSETPLVITLKVLEGLSSLACV